VIDIKLTALSYNAKLTQQNTTSS